MNELILLILLSASNSSSRFVRVAFTKVNAISGESEEEKEFISIIAILHDIGAVEAQKKYGSIDGVYQEKEGPEVAKEILKKVG